MTPINWPADNNAEVFWKAVGVEPSYVGCQCGNPECVDTKPEYPDLTLDSLCEWLDKNDLEYCAVRCEGRFETTLISSDSKVVVAKGKTLIEAICLAILRFKGFTVNVGESL